MVASTSRGWSKNAMIASGVIGLLGATYTWSRWRTRKPHLSKNVAEKLPVAKSLDTIPDQVGNYDLDGVSYDTEGVIVGSDKTKHTVAPI